ncbi:MAG: GntR family transcriptional regulator, partial [Actinomycetota bacterium]
QIADEIRAAIWAGEYEPTDEAPTRNELPGAAELARKHKVSDKTAQRALQQLIDQGLVRSRPGLRPVVIPAKERVNRWPMDGRSVRARRAGGFVFGNDIRGREVVNQVTGTGWRAAPDSIAPLLRVSPGARVWARARRTLVDGRVGALSVSYFPAELAEGTSLTAPGPFPPGGIEWILKEAGHRVVRTQNEVRARLATSDELEAFGPGPDLAPLHGRIVIEMRYAAYGLSDEPLMAGVGVRPASENTVVFQTQEADEEGPGLMVAEDDSS